ncbi:MAG: LUD domain-containing protein [Anaerolineae bacterium]|nr:LUD domain-containing protein [Anaerolineae bacterium]MCI0609239.1 LUD domain-containing protein [Anaerolineae bacterium]
MTTEFRSRIRKAIANPTLQIALDANAERRVKGRVNALETLPNWRERRQKAHSIRADVINHLDQYLDQFISSAQANGIIIHRAKNATEAIKIVLEIIKNLPQRHREHREGQREVSVSQRESASPILVAKSKSMVSEEIELNHALEAEGIKVVETDLGEYIVQLRNEKPAHIITPAVHLRRNDVGKLFHEKLGIPYTEDIPTLTNTARKVLRNVFLTADVGITGVNFGVAETGGICLVTNEGNGRMVTTLPPIHIALMGMERLVRNLDDLAILLSLLPRSATGQKLSVYTQLIHKPLANQQRHIIILDNGRTGLRNSPLKESLYCIRCGACLNACPVFRELSGHAYNSTYSGPIGSVISAGFFGSDFVPLAQASSLCGACKEACPVDIDLPKLLVRVRSGLAPHPTPSAASPDGSPKGMLREGTKGEGDGGLSTLSKLFMRIYSRVARSPRLFALSQRFASLGSYLVSPFSSMVRLPAFTGWGYSKDLPRFASKPFRARFHREDAKSTKILIKEEEKKEELREPPASAVQIDKVEQFIKEFTAVGGKLNRSNANDLTNKVIDLLQSKDITRIHLGANVLDEDLLQKAGITISRTPDPAIRVGVTKSICGLADTGSILEKDGEGEPLHASLLPEIHIALLRESEILPSLDQAIHLMHESKSAVFITGPSRTGDIEMSQTIGVHGPGEVHVFLVDE